MNLKRLEFTLTTRCNSQCIHCQAEASPLKDDVMNVEDALDYLVEAASVSRLESFMVFGGEPMLYPELVVALLNEARLLGIPRIDMITNGMWGKDKDTAEKWASRLKNAGLTNVDVSVDAFHARHIPVEHARNAALALLKARVERVNWNVAVIESIESENEYDTKTRQILKELEPLGIETRFVKILPVGRAVKNLGGFFKHEPIHGPCEGDPILGNSLTDPNCITIEPNGSVDICWHLAIGNAKEKALSRIISEYDWQKNLLIKTLVEEGPLGLLKLSETREFGFQEDRYIDRCHLCREIRQFLQKS